jgi:hypothetical protein
VHASDLRQTAIVGVAILVVAFAANLAGVFDTGDTGTLTAEGVTSSASSSAAPSTPRASAGTRPSQTTAPGPSDSSAPGGGEVSIVSVTSPVSLGATASLTARANPGANCTIVYTHPSGKTSVAAGLEPTTAGRDGTVAWSWLISNQTNPVGNGSVIVTCDGKSAQTPIVIQ